VGLQKRFVEVMNGVQDIAKTESLARNLAALDKAKDVLKVLSANVPLSVRTSVVSAEVSTSTVTWAQGIALVQVRSERWLCSGPLEWNRIDQIQGPARLAFYYLSYVLDDNLSSWLTTACRG
jgi:hypothetical protein